MFLVFLPHEIAGLGQQTAGIQSVVSCPHVIPIRTSPAVPETLAGTARHPSGIESPPQDHRHSGRQSLRRLRLSCARPPPIDRIRSAGIRWRAAVKRLLPAVYLSSSPTTDRLPRLPPSTISGSGEVSVHRPSVYRLVVRVLFDPLHGAPVCADRLVDPPVRFHTPATSCRRFREKLYAEARRSYRGVIRRLGGGAGR